MTSPRIRNRIGRRRPGRLASTGLAALVVTAALVRPGNVPLELRTSGAGGPAPHPAPASAPATQPPGR